MNTAHEIITEPEIASSNAAIRIHSRGRSGSWGTHSPVVMATLKGIKMENCDEVREVYAECLRTHSSDSICKTAASYFRVCTHQSQE